MPLLVSDRTAYRRFALREVAAANLTWSERRPASRELGLTRFRLNAGIFAFAVRDDRIPPEDLARDLDVEGHCALLFARSPEWVRSRSFQVVFRAFQEAAERPRS